MVSICSATPQGLVVVVETDVSFVFFIRLFASNIYKIVDAKYVLHHKNKRFHMYFTSYPIIFCQLPKGSLTVIKRHFTYCQTVFHQLTLKTSHTQAPI